MNKNIFSFLHARRYTALFCLIVFAQCLLILFWGNQKNIGYVDEYHTLEGSAQSAYGKKYWDTQGDFYGKEYSHEDFREFMTTNEDDLLISKGFSEVADALVNRSFYYTCVNLGFSILPGVLTKWVGILINVLLFVGTQYLLYRVSSLLADKKTGLLIMGIYGFSAGAISVVLYIRMYMMLTFLAVSLFALQVFYARCTSKLQRILYILSNLILLVIGYRIHQFGVVIYGVIIIAGLLNLGIKKERSKLWWMLLGHIIPALFLGPVVVQKVKGLFYGKVKTMLEATVKYMSMEMWEERLEIISANVTSHLFGNTGYILLICILFFLIWFQNRKKNVLAQIGRTDFEWILAGFIAIGYLTVMVIGGAEQWRYSSPIYPFIIMFIVLLFRRINIKAEITDFNSLLFIGLFVVYSITSWNDEHISYLYQDKDELQAYVNENYEDINGIMIHHGLSRSWLYEAASYWPEHSNVLVINESELENESFSYARDDEKILLWLSIDYDNEELIDLFKERTDYQKIRLAFKTDSLRVYECNK